MHVNVYNHLKKHSQKEPYLIDRLIISAYLSFHNLEVNHNELILSYIIENQELTSELYDLNELLRIIHDSSNTFDFEDLIELFEFVISPADKTVNGAVYTPLYIRSFIINELLQKTNVPIELIKGCDPACGCGGFLLNLSAAIKTLTQRTFAEIYETQIFGVDITEYSIIRSKLLLSLQAIENGEDANFNFNLHLENSLTYDFILFNQAIIQNGGFDLIVGNPPYVASRNMDAKTLQLSLQWEVALTGHPDLYIPFFQLGYESLNENGILGYITVNTFIKSINGRALRRYFERQNINLTILNFGGEQVFKDRNTYTCVCFLRPGNGEVNYIRTTSNQLNTLDFRLLNQFDYEDLDHHSGWTLVNNNELLTYINRIENTGIPFKDLYNTKNGIATLKNNIYKFRPTAEDEAFYYLTDNKIIYPIERGICRNIVNANKIKTQDDIIRLQEKIIFPYGEQTQIISEEIMESNFPFAYKYLKAHKEILAKRDKGNRDYETWYAYGRRQSMDIHAFKLFFPHICDRPTFVICEDQDLLFYNGMAVVSTDIQELVVLKKLLESDLFFEYIKNTTKDYASGYISMSRNYIKNFGVYQFNEEQKRTLLNMDDIHDYIKDLYLV